MIKVLFVVNSLVRRGAEQQLHNFVKALPLSLDVSVFTFSSAPDNFPEFFSDNRICVYLSRYQGTYNPFRIWPLINCLRHVKPEVIVTVGLGAALLLGRIAAGFCGAKVVYSQLNTFENFNNLPMLEGEYFDILNNCMNRFLFVFSGNRTYRFLANSNQLAERVIRSAGRYPVHTFYNGLPLGDIQRLTDQQHDEIISKILEQISGFPVIVQVGALDKNKNPLFTLDCLSAVKRSIPDVLLVLIGDGPLKGEIYNRVKKNDLDENVIIVGQLPIKSCFTLMKCSNVIVLTSHSESFPNVLVEAQALGVAAVTFDVGAAKEIVENGVTGYVVEPGNGRAFVNRIKELLLDRVKSENMGEKGRERVLRLFNMQRKVDLFLNMVQHDLDKARHQTIRK